MNTRSKSKAKLTSMQSDAETTADMSSKSITAGNGSAANGKICKYHDWLKSVCIVFKLLGSSPLAVFECMPIIYLIGHNIPNTTNDLQPQTALLLLIFIFGVAASFLGFVYSSFPDMSETESSYVKFPKVGVSIHHNIRDL